MPHRPMAYSGLAVAVEWPAASGKDTLVTHPRTARRGLPGWCLTLAWRPRAQPSHRRPIPRPQRSMMDPDHHGYQPSLWLPRSPQPMRKVS